VGMMTTLNEFRVDGNNLRGALPTELGLLTNMATFRVFDNAGLCGDLVSVGSVGVPIPTIGTSYTDGIDNTNLGTVCPRLSPCCDTLRQNPVFCCLEARRPEFALSVCDQSC